MGFIKSLFGGKSKTSASISTPNINGGISVKTDSEIPEFQGDYAKAVFLNAYQKSSKIKEDKDYQRYLIYECGIKKPSQYHKQMINEGLLEKASIEVVLGSLKANELKDILREHSLLLSGKKADLLKRTLELVPEEKLQIYVDSNNYAISESGKQFLVEHDDYIQIHKHLKWDIDWKEYDTLKAKGGRFNDIVWGILNERLMHSRTFGRSEYLCMYELVSEEGKDNRAFEMLLSVLVLDVSGTVDMSIFDSYKKGYYSKKDLKEYFHVAITLAPGILNMFSKYRSVYKLETVEHIYDTFTLPVQICDKELFLNLAESATLDDGFDIEKFKAQLQKNYNVYISGL